MIPDVAELRTEVVEVATGHRFVCAATLVATLAVYRVGYRLREVWGFALPDGFHYLAYDVPTCDNAGGL